MFQEKTYTEEQLSLVGMFKPYDQELRMAIVGAKLVPGASFAQSLLSSGLHAIKLLEQVETRLLKGLFKG